MGCKLQVLAVDIVEKMLQEFHSASKPLNLSLIQARKNVFFLIYAGNNLISIDTFSGANSSPGEFIKCLFYLFDDNNKVMCNIETIFITFREPKKADNALSVLGVYL